MKHLLDLTFSRVYWMLVNKKRLTRVEFSERERVFPARVGDSCQEFLSFLVTINYTQASIIRSPSRRVCVSALGTLMYSRHFPHFYITSSHQYFECWGSGHVSPLLVRCYDTLPLLLPGLVSPLPILRLTSSPLSVSTQWRIVIDALPGPGMEEGTILS